MRADISLASAGRDSRQVTTKKFGCLFRRVVVKLKIEVAGLAGWRLNVVAIHQTVLVNPFGGPSKIAFHPLDVCLAARQEIVAAGNVASKLERGRGLPPVAT